jgi:hypothetical protein
MIQNPKTVIQIHEKHEKSSVRNPHWKTTVIRPNRSVIYSPQFSEGIFFIGGRRLHRVPAPGVEWNNPQGRRRSW